MLSERNNSHSALSDSFRHCRKIEWAMCWGRQVLRSATSIGANYREALRVTSRKHFLSTISIVLREADETLYWLELLAESGIVKMELLQDLIDENKQLVSIFAATVKTTRRNSTKS